MVSAMLDMRKGGVTSFTALPEEFLRVAWPTRARTLFSDPASYFARTRVNPDYGLPGWTRDCGKRFHRGCDIAPVRVRATGGTATVLFSDCATGREYPSVEPAFEPDDDIFAVHAGRVAEVNDTESKSSLGLFVVVEHRWPSSGRVFHTLYAHLADLAVQSGDLVEAGARLGRMGATSRSADARAWMSIAPHLHFEVIAESGAAHDPALFLRTNLPAPPP